jgi:hypothetical protein
MECETQQQRIRELLVQYVDPKPQFDGFTAWWMAGKILDAIAEPALDGIALGGMPHGSDCAYWCNEPCDCLTAREVM